MVKERRSKNIRRKQRKKNNTHKRRVSKRNTLRRKNFRGGAPQGSAPQDADMYVLNPETMKIMNSISETGHKNYHIYSLGKLEENATPGTGGGFVQQYYLSFIVTKIITNSSIFKYLEREDSVIIELAVVDKKPVQVDTRGTFDSMEPYRKSEWFLVFLPYTIKVGDFSTVFRQSCFTEKCKEERIQEAFGDLKIPFLLHSRIANLHSDKIKAIVKSIINEQGDSAPNLPSNYESLFPEKGAQAAYRKTEETSNPVTASN